jgi:hypothetical protein
MSNFLRSPYFGTFPGLKRPESHNFRRLVAGRVAACRLCRGIVRTLLGQRNTRLAVKILNIRANQSHFRTESPQRASDFMVSQQVNVARRHAT